jgi:hypothetical protein
METGLLNGDGSNWFQRVDEPKKAVPPAIGPKRRKIRTWQTTRFRISTADGGRSSKRCHGTLLEEGHFVQLGSVMSLLRTLTGDIAIISLD